MGSFSFTKADDLTKVANIVIGAPFKLLIPKEFGGGYINDHYQDYGYIGHKEDGSPKYDMLELVAFWNANTYAFPYVNRLLKDRLIWDDEDNEGDNIPVMKEIDEYTKKNRKIGINITSDYSSIRLLKYPLKLVSASYKGTYEDCIGMSFDDPYQGARPLYRYKYTVDKSIQKPLLKTYIARWKLDKLLLDRKKFKGSTKDIELLEDRIKRHERDIINYVTSDEFEKILINLNL
jgi:hypothetical protein